MDDPYSLIDRLASKIMSDHQKARPEAFASYKGEPNDPWLEETKKQLTFLFDAANLDSPSLFSNYIAWSKIIMHHAGVPTELLLEKMQHIREQCHQMLTGPFASKVDQILESTIKQFSEMAESTPSYIDENDAMGKVASRYIDQVLRGEKAKALDTVKEAMAQGANLQDIYISIFQRTQYEIGRRWQEGQISVAQEHYVTEVTEQIMSQVFAGIRHGAGYKGPLVITCVGNEMHEMGAKMVADFLELDGWDVSFLGSNTPHPDVISITKDRKAKVLMVSVTMAYNVKRVRSLIKHARADPALTDLKILVGGNPFNSVEDLWRSIGADGFAKDAKDAVRLVNEMTGQR